MKLPIICCDLAVSALFFPVTHLSSHLCSYCRIRLASQDISRDSSSGISDADHRYMVGSLYYGAWLHRAFIEANLHWHRVYWNLPPSSGLAGFGPGVFRSRFMDLLQKNRPTCNNSHYNHPIGLDQRLSPPDLQRNLDRFQTGIPRLCFCPRRLVLDKCSLLLHSNLNCHPVSDPGIHPIPQII